MHPFLIALATHFYLTLYAQTGQIKVFRKTEYLNGKLYRQTSDTIKVLNKRVDIYFFRQHFFLPYYLPEKFLDRRYKNQKISEWQNPTGKKDYHRNWEYTYTYDSLGRVINYGYSGCFVCSNLPYKYTVTYNSRGQVERIVNTKNFESEFKFYYNNMGDIVKLDAYFFEKLKTKLEVVH